MRTPITLKIKFKSASLDQFIERYSVDVSRGGIFIRTKEPLAVGTPLKFEFQLQDASSLIIGEGTVVWVREHDPNRTNVAPGMGVKFDRLQPTSLQVLEKILTEKSRRGEAQTESRFDAGVRASSAASNMVSATPAPAVVTAKRPDPPVPVPAPAPAPGLHAEEFGDESTRVMQNDVVQRLADQTRDQLRPTATGPARGVIVDREAQTAILPAQPQKSAAPRPSPPENVAPPATTPSSGQPTAASAAPQKKLERPIDLSQESGRPAPQKKRGSSAPLVVVAMGLCVLAGGYLYLNQDGRKPKSEAVLPVTPPPVAPAVAARAPEPPPPKPAGQTIPIISDPPGAQVTIDGTALPSPTPTTFSGFDEKKVYEVHVLKRGFHDWMTRLSPKAGEKISATLVLKEKEVEVTSTPGGAEIVLDGKKVGRTPFTIKKFDLSKAHALEVKRTGFVNQTVNITSDDTFESKGDKDVLQVALTLEAEVRSGSGMKKGPKKLPMAAGGSTPSGGADPAVPPAVPKDQASKTDVSEQAAAEKAAAEKAAPEKAVEKTGEEKPAEDKQNIKVPGSMKQKPSEAPAEGEKAAE